MSYCHAYEDPFLLISEARDYAKKNGSSTVAKVEAEVALKLTEAAYSDVKAARADGNDPNAAKPTDAEKFFLAARSDVGAASSGYYSMGTEAAYETKLAVQLSEISHFDRIGNPQAADYEMRVVEQENGAPSTQNLSADTRLVTSVAVGLAKVEHLDAQGKTVDAKKALEQLSQSVTAQEKTSSASWGAFTAAETEIGLGKYRFFEKHNQPDDATTALIGAQAGVYAHKSDWGAPSTAIMFKAASAVDLGKAAQLQRNQNCDAADLILNGRAQQMDLMGSNNGMTAGDKAKVKTAFAIGKVGMQTGAEVSPAINLLLTEFAHVGKGIQ